MARKRYLIDGIGVASWLFGNFSMRDERYYFRVEGSMRGGHEVGMVMQGDFAGMVEGTPSCVHMRWECTPSGNGHMR